MAVGRHWAEPANTKARARDSWRAYFEENGSPQPVHPAYKSQPWNGGRAETYSERVQRLTGQQAK